MRSGDEIKNEKGVGAGSFVRGKVGSVGRSGAFVPARRYALDKEFSGFLDRQESLTELLDGMFHVKHD